MMGDKEFKVMLRLMELTAKGFDPDKLSTPDLEEFIEVRSKFLKNQGIKED